MIYHIHYIEDKNPGRLQQLVDSGELYKYLMDLHERVEDAVTAQKDLWVGNDEKYKAIVLNDPVGAGGRLSVYDIRLIEKIKLGGNGRVYHRKRENYEKIRAMGFI